MNEDGRSMSNKSIRDPARRGPMGRSLKDAVEYRMRQDANANPDASDSQLLTQAEARESDKRTEKRESK